MTILLAISRTPTACSFVTPGKSSKKSSMEIPFSRCQKRVSTDPLAYLASR